jgi:hypothetical protein
MNQKSEKKLSHFRKRLKNKALSHNEKIEAKRFLEDTPALEIKPSDIRLNDNSKEARNAAKKEAVDRARANGRQVIATPEADIVIEPSGIKKSLDHSINQEKLDALPYIPEVIKKGITVDISDDFDGKPIRNIHKVLPVKTDSDKDLLMIRARQNMGQKPNFYNHLFLKLKGDAKNLPSGVSTDDTPANQKADSKSVAYIKNILQDILNVKENEQ